MAKNFTDTSVKQQKTTQRMTTGLKIPLNPEFALEQAKDRDEILSYPLRITE